MGKKISAGSKMPKGGKEWEEGWRDRRYEKKAGNKNLAMQHE